LKYVNKDILKVLDSDPGAGVSVLDRDGKIIYMNEVLVRLHFSEALKPADIEGKTFHEIGFSKHWADERVELLRQMEKTGEEYIIRTIWQGCQQFSWVRSMNSSHQGHDFRALVVTRRIGSGEEADYLLKSETKVVKSEVTGLGKLCVLTKRELEVLALIGQGKTAKEIAGCLHRSTKTIENHRISIGNKLNKTNKVELALIAREAGLTADDSTRIRICTAQKCS